MKLDYRTLWIPCALFASLLLYPIVAGSAESQNHDIHSEKLPAIEAETTRVKVLARSNSNKIYLLTDTFSKSPMPGHMILLKNPQQEPTMALRVIKVYPDTRKFAAKSLKTYGSTEILNPNDEWVAVKKLGDKVTLTSVPKDQSELKEIEDERALVILPSPSPLVSPSAPPLPEPSPSLLPSAEPSPEAPPPTEAADGPPPPGTPPESPPSSSEDEAENTTDAAATEEDDEENDDPDTGGLVVNQTHRYDRYTFWLSAGLGVARSANPGDLTQALYLSSGAFRFGVTLAQNALLEGKIQDSFALELGIFPFKVVATGGDTYTLVTMTPTLRYNIVLSEHMTFFIYGGFGRSVAIAAANPVDTTLAGLQSFSLAGGAGLLFQIGPAWYTRLDAGYEAITLSLLLRF